MSRYWHLFYIGHWKVDIGYDLHDLYVGNYWRWSHGDPFCGKRYLTLFFVFFTLVLRLERKYHGWKQTPIERFQLWQRERTNE